MSVGLLVMLWSVWGAPRPFSMRGRESQLRQVGLVYVLRNIHGLMQEVKEHRLSRGK